MKFKLAALYFALLFHSTAFAQIEIDKQERLLLDKQDSLGTSGYKAYINVSGDFYVNSNSVTNKFINNLAYQRIGIEDPDKDRESNRLKKNNRLGADANAAIQATFKKNQLAYTIGFGQRVFLGARFSNDLFELAFRGNAPYAGKNVALSKTAVTYFDYKNIFVGIQKTSKNNKVTTGATAAFLIGGNYQHAKLNSTTLFTEQTGEYIDLNGDILYSKTGADSSKKSHGKGVGVNLFFSIKQNKNRLNIEVRDLGFSSWKNVKTYSGDSTYRYEGLLIDELLTPGSSISASVKLDSIADYVGIDRSVKNTTVFLPTVFHVNYMISPNKRFTRTVGVRYMAAPGYIPRFYIREADFLGKGFTLTNTFSYGGYGRLDYELGVMKKIKDGFIISANLFAFEYLVMPGKSSGHGLNFGLTKLF